MLKSFRPHIGIFGKRNVGKSSFINKITEQDISIVSSLPGTTTDAVYKTIEMSDLGPVVLIDTAGIDDLGDLGKKRIKTTIDVIKKIDFAVLLISENNFDIHEEKLISLFNEYKIPFAFIYNKNDLTKISKSLESKLKSYGKKILNFSNVSAKKEDVKNLIDLISKNIPKKMEEAKIFDGLIEKNDHVLLVTPIDKGAPRGRMILPQVQAIRDVLDHDSIVTTLKETELKSFFKSNYPKPKIVVTDSQAFKYVNRIVPKDIFLTSFSILFARMKGDFNLYVNGTPSISKLKENDHVLILESCSHHSSEDDIGRIKIPRWIKEFIGKNVNFDIVSSFNNLPKNIKEYKLVIQCGGCMLTRVQVLNRLKPAIDNGIAVSNYGMAIAYLNGIFDRAIVPFKK
jgi:[FeFe] hydrogenase H-cluster maturation GTPase HydF